MSKTPKVARSCSLRSESGPMCRTCCNITNECFDSVTRSLFRRDFVTPWCESSRQAKLPAGQRLIVELAIERYLLQGAAGLISPPNLPPVPAAQRRCSPRNCRRSFLMQKTVPLTDSHRLLVRIIPGEAFKISSPNRVVLSYVLGMNQSENAQYFVLVKAYHSAHGHYLSKRD